MRELVILTALLLSSCSRFALKRNKPLPKGYPGLVKSRILENVGNMRFCYEKYLNQHPEAFEGKVTLNLKITPKGSVRTVMLSKDSINNLQVKGCLVKMVMTMQFPPHKWKEDFSFKQPLSFKFK